MKEKSSHKFWHTPFILVHHLIKAPGVILLGILFILIGVIVININGSSFWVMAIGVPALIVGVSIGLYGIYDLLAGFLYPTHQKMDCPFCHKGGP